VWITITNNTPSVLYYWCWNHQAMGNSATVDNPGSGGGAAGPQGPIGATGPQGPIGATGPQGAASTVPGPQGLTGPTGPQGLTGPQGTSVVLKGSVATVADLDNIVGPAQGDLYVVLADGNGYVWSGTAWNNAGPIQGPEGPTGPQGDPGLQGATGPTGAASTVPGPTGPTGPAGEASTVSGPTGPTGPAGTSGSSSISWSISSSGSTDYVFSGPGIETGNTNDPVLYLYKGFTYTFVNTTGGSHPFAIRVSNGGSNYTRGVSGSQTGTQTFIVPMDAPSTLYYQCTIHSGMGNVINII